MDAILSAHCICVGLSTTYIFRPESDFVLICKIFFLGSGGFGRSFAVLSVFKFIGILSLVFKFTNTFWVGFGRILLERFFDCWEIVLSSLTLPEFDFVLICKMFELGSGEFWWSFTAFSVFKFIGVLS